MIKVRLIDNKEIIGESSKFNIFGSGEVIIHFNDGDNDSEFISNIEVLINNKWISFREAFKNHDLISDIMNSNFYEPKDEEERKRGYRL